MLESLKSYAASAKQTFNRLKNTFSMDPSISLVSKDSQNPSKGSGLGMFRADISNRLWLHANQQHPWAIQRLSYMQEDIHAVTDYVNGLSYINETLGAPVKVSSTDSGSFTLLDWISVEKALIEYQIRVLIQGPTTTSEVSKQKQVQVLKKTGRTPYMLFYSDCHSAMARFLKKASETDFIDYLFIHVIFGGLTIMLSGVLPYMISGKTYMLPWYASLATLFYGTGAWAIYKSRLVEKSLFNMSWVRKISKTWDDVFHIKTPQDAVLLGHVATRIGAWRLMQDANGDANQGLKLPGWSPLDVLAYCQHHKDVDSVLVVQAERTLRPLDTVPVPEVFIQNSEVVQLLR